MLVQHGDWADGAYLWSIRADGNCTDHRVAGHHGAGAGEERELGAANEQSGFEVADRKIDTLTR